MLVLSVAALCSGCTTWSHSETASNGEGEVRTHAPTLRGGSETSLPPHLGGQKNHRIKPVVMWHSSLCYVNNPKEGCKRSETLEGGSAG